MGRMLPAIARRICQHNVLDQQSINAKRLKRFLRHRLCQFFIFLCVYINVYVHVLFLSADSKLI